MIIATVSERVAALRGLMERRGIAACIVPTADPHLSEYLPAHWQAREWLSGFTGSAGTLVVTRDFAGLWTDSRYFSQAERQFAGSGIELVKLNVPHTPEHVEWLCTHVREGDKVACAADMLSLASERALRKALAERGAELVEDDLPGAIWDDRPPLPHAPVYEHPMEYAIHTRAEKLADVREAMQKTGATHHVVSALDEIAWVLNLRGSDVDYNPVFLSHLLIDMEGATLFVEASKREMNTPPPARGGRPEGEKTAGHDDASLPQRGRAGVGEQQAPAPFIPQPLPANLKVRARELRGNLTNAEKLVWDMLRKEKLGVKFRRQHPVDPYVLDFYCVERKLAVEIDGGQHNEAAGRARDERRTAFLQEKKIRVLRFWNNEVFENPEGVWDAIAGALKEAPPPQPSPAGGGRKAAGARESPTASGGRDSLEQLRADDVRIEPYEAIRDALGTLPPGAKLLLAPGQISAAIAHAIPDHVALVEAPGPIGAAKARKGDKEMDHVREAMRRDGVALVRGARWLEHALKKGERLTELDVDTKLRELRSRQPGFVSESFSTIAGYEANAALPHYSATPESHSELKPKGMLLIDSGAQYLGGTTDVTRMWALGETTPEQRRDVTLVLKGVIALSRAKFPRGASGQQLDALARAPIWAAGVDYGHGTGHGVGYCLNVHEGPQSIRPPRSAQHLEPMDVGMITSIEPGIYKPGRHGVRIENLAATISVGDGEFGEFLAFETLTLCPIDTRLLDLSMLDAAELAWLDAYHATVRERIAPLLEDPADRAWLDARCAPLAKAKAA